MTGKTNGFITNFLNAIGPQNVVVSRCIIPHENLYTKVLDFEDIMGNVVKCVNYIRAQGLNHRQFKTFLEELDSEYSNVVAYISLLYVGSVELSL